MVGFMEDPLIDIFHTYAIIVKKMFLQGKPASGDNIYHMKRELGDIMWYWAQACMALHLDPYTVLKKNIKKLESRYPGGKFSVEKSEKR